MREYGLAPLRTRPPNLDEQESIPPRREYDGCGGDIARTLKQYDLLPHEYRTTRSGVVIKSRRMNRGFKFN